jgi:tetratricopeptide (TPR) repeat protein
MNASDRGDYPAAFTHLAASVDRAQRGADPRQQAWSLAALARAHLLRGERSQATGALSRSLELTREQRWMAFLPWPQTLRAELDLFDGDIDGAADRLEQAWVLACQLNDPCWEGMAGRGLAMLHAGRGDYPGATEWLDLALTRASREPDRYQWVHAHVLDTAVGTALDQSDGERARHLASSLSSLAGRCDLREMQVHAQLHLGRLGDRRAGAAARSLSADIDNPALRELVSR